MNLLSATVSQFHSFANTFIQWCNEELWRSGTNHNNDPNRNHEIYNNHKRFRISSYLAR